MTHLSRRGLLAGASLAALSPVARAQDANALLHQLPGTDIYPESVVVDQASGDFYVGSVKHGTLFRGRVGDPSAISVFSPAGAGGRSMATGLSYRNGRLAVGGRQTGQIFVYDTATGRQLASLHNGRQGTDQTFLNDVAFAPDGSAYVTDSVQPVLYRIVPEGEGYRLTTFLTFADGPVRYTAAAGAPGININGLAVTADGRYLLINKRNENALFRVNLDTRAIIRVETAADMFNTADGLFLDGETLYAAQNTPRAVGVARFSADFSRATLERNIPHPSFAFPTSVARYRNRLLVVSAQFDTRGSPAAVSGNTPPREPFWVSEIDA